MSFHSIIDDNIEIYDEIPKNLTLTHAIFDHDGTLSVIRRGWESVMSDFMYEELSHVVDFQKNTALELKEKIQEFINQTTGIRTLEQMDGLIEMLKKYSQNSTTPIKSRYAYKQCYLKALMNRVNANISKIKNNKNITDDFLIKGSVAFLKALSLNLNEIYLASGTDEIDVQNEANVLGLAKFFNGGIYGAKDELDYDIKAFVIEQISNNIGRKNMKNAVVIGDGPVEIREGRKWGALTIGVASNEDKLAGVNRQKKERLIKARAHIIIGDYQVSDKILKMLNLKIGVMGHAI